jgi:hypothetical protein
MDDNGIMILGSQASNSPEERLSLLEDRAQGTSDTGVPPGRHKVLQVRCSGVGEARGQDGVGGAGRGRQGGLRVRVGGAASE